MNKYLVSSLLLLSLLGCGGEGSTEIGRTDNPITFEVVVPTEPEPTDPGPTEPEVAEVVLQELAPGFCAIDGIIESTNLGFSGSGYANTDNAIGTQLTWQVNATTAGDYDVEITYTAPTDRPSTLTSNSVDSTVAFASSGSWESWIVEAAVVSLVAGDNDIVLTSTTEEGAPNIDSIKITGVGITAGSCIYVVPEAPSVDTQVFVISDSTAANYGASKYPQTGWGQVLQNFFDDSEIEVVNRARGGRSSRNFYTEVGLWDEVIQELDTGDYLLIQFGHNDRDNSPDKDRYTSPEDFEGYLANFVNEARAKGAIPILVSPMVMNAYRDGALRNVFTEGGSDYAGSTAKVATDLDVAYIDLNQKSYDLVNSLGIEQASHYLYLILDAGEYPNYADGSNDGTHFQEMGAIEMSRLIVEGAEELNARSDMATLLASVKHRYAFTVEQEGANGSIITQGNSYPAGTPLTVKTIAGDTDTFNAWYSVGQNVSETNIYQTTMPTSKYNLVAAFNGAVPVANFNAATAFIIGDSTVADYTAGYYPQTGWGQVLQPFFDASKITIDNRALGGRSSKSFYENHWADVKASISEGDFVFIQFGINDRASDDPARYAPTGGDFEGFMTNFANETIALGATPIFVSSVRRNQWQDGIPYDAWHEHPVVTRELAATLGVALIDLDGKNKALLEEVGEDYANKFYYMGFGANEYANYLAGKSDTVHFQEAGAVEMARLVQEGITELSTNQAIAPLIDALKPLYPLAVTSPTAEAGMFTKGYSYPAGTPLTLKALASNGSVFTQWLDKNSAQITDESIYMFTAEDSAAEFSAVFNNSEGLGIPTTNLAIELDGANVKLTWDVRNYVEEITNLALYRYEVGATTASATQAEGGTLLVADATAVGSFVDNTAIAGKRYTYSFKITQGTTVTDTVEPETEVRIPFVEEIPVTNVIAVVDGTAIDLSWDIKYFDPEISYLEVHRNDKNEILGRTRIAGGAPLKGSLRDENLEPGKTYWYMFKMVQDGVTNNTNPEAETMIPVDAVPTVDPNAPTEDPVTNLTTAVNGTDIQVTWDLQNFYPEITYLELYRNDVNQAAGRTRVYAGAPLSGSYLDESLEPGKTYWYMFKMTKGGVTSSTDPESETLIPVDAVANPKANITSAIDGEAVSVSWDIANVAEGAYVEIHRNDKNEILGRSRIVSSAAYTDTFVDDTVEAGKTYWYMAKIVLDGVTTNTNPEAEITAPESTTEPEPEPEPEVPAGPPVTNLSTVVNDGVVTVSWNIENVAEGTYIEIHRNDKNEILGRGRIVKGATLTDSFIDDTVESGKTYWYMTKMVIDGATVNTDPEAETVVP